MRALSGDQGLVCRCGGWLSLWCAVTAAAAAEPVFEGQLDAWRADAELTAINVVDARTAWAVGDRGTIWHTEDAGRHWQLQHTPVDCRLNDVCFIDRRRGWAVGIASQSAPVVTRGVVLKTTDGGTTWKQIRRALVPGLLKVKFFSPRQGLALAQPSALFPTGVLTTEDGGLSWGTVVCNQRLNWSCGDFPSAEQGALAGFGGATAQFSEQRLVVQPGGNFDLRTARQLRLNAAGVGWLVGDGGLLLVTQDRGQSWQPPATIPSRDFDFRAVAVEGEHCWIAGSPGTRVFHTTDQGQTWNSTETGCNTPLLALSFADARHGFAVGALGAILATRDGGQTWTRQRGSARRVALSCLHVDPAQIPWELLGWASAGKGYLSHVALLGRRDVDAQSRVPLDFANRAHAGLVAVGGSAVEVAWQFPLRQAALRLPAEQRVAAWDRFHHGEGLDVARQYLVRQIRTWRPAVVVTDHADSATDESLAHLLHQLVLQAVEEAAQPQPVRDPLGLQPWQVKRLYASLPAGQRGSFQVTSGQVAARAGRTLGDFGSEARLKLVDGQSSFASAGPPAEMRGYRLLVNRVPGGGDLFRGLGLELGGEARRAAESPSQTLNQLQRVAFRSRNLQAAIRQSETDPVARQALGAALGRSIHELPPRLAGRLLHQVASRAHFRGEWKLAATLFDLLADEFPEHPLSDTANVWLLHLYTSQEIRHRRGVPTQDPPSPTASLSGKVELAAATEQLPRWQRLQLRVVEHLEQTRPLLFAEPPVALAVAAGARQRADDARYEQQLKSLQLTPQTPAWQAAVAAERWIQSGKGPPPVPVARIAACQNAPHLDGQIDEPLWQTALPLALTSQLGDDGDWPAEVRLAYDQEFIYCAVRCARAPGVDYATETEPRIRDAQLADRDHVDLLFDVDRDRATYFRLSIDHRGHCSDACWGDVSWNPQWYIAHHSDREWWTVEVAIPLAELIDPALDRQGTWCCGLQRTVPGVGFQSWTRNASVAIDASGFGLLSFD